MAALAANIVSFDGNWTWFNDPRAVYDSATQRLFWGEIRSDGKVAVNSWDFLRQLYLRGTPRTSVLQIDDHDNPALCILDNGEILAAYSVHTGDSFSCRTNGATDIRTWRTEVAVASVANDDAYAHLMQMGDTAKSVFWFYRRNGSTQFRVSTDRGDTWGGDTTLISNAGERPYFKCVKTSRSRIDFVSSTGHPGEIATSLYHGYITVAADGSITYFKSDGTTGGSFFRQSQLAGANFKNANLVDASFYDARLFETSLDGANILGASFAHTTDRPFIADREDLSPEKGSE